MRFRFELHGFGFELHGIWFELHGFYKVPILIINHLRFLSCKKGFELHGKNTVKKRYFFSDFLSLWISRWISRWISVLTY